jgi:hypothetical protein
VTETRELSERYSRAMHSSHLEVDPERCDVDYLIAAGLVRDGMGARLFRLATEWDLAAGDYRLALRHVRAVELQAMQIQRNATRHPVEGEKLLQEAAALLVQAQQESLTAKALALVHLKTLREAKTEVGEYARLKANHIGFMEPDRIVNALAGRALQLFLDATCVRCSGRGFSGGFNAPRTLCTACGASGRAHYHLSKTERHSSFIRGLLAKMDLECHRVQQQMSRFLRQRG